MVGERFISRPLGEKRLWHLFILHLKKWHEKTPEALRRLGFSDRHLFRSLNVVAGVGFEPHDLRVMSPTSYQAALPRDMKLKWCRRTGSNRHGDHSPRDFKSRASASSAIPAYLRRRAPLQMLVYYITTFLACQPLFAKTY